MTDLECRILQYQAAREVGRALGWEVFGRKEGEGWTKDTYRAYVAWLGMTDMRSLFSTQISNGVR